MIICTGYLKINHKNILGYSYGVMRVGGFLRKLLFYKIKV